MQLKIWEPKKPEEEEPIWDGDVKVHIVGQRIYLDAVNKNGELLPGGDLIRLKLGKGAFHFKDVNKKLGFPLDENGRIKND